MKKEKEDEGFRATAMNNNVSRESGGMRKKSNEPGVCLSPTMLQSPWLHKEVLLKNCDLPVPRSPSKR